MFLGGKRNIMEFTMRLFFIWFLYYIWYFLIYCNAFAVDMQCARIMKMFLFLRFIST